MNTLFPEMEAEIRDERKAAKRERVQRCRDWLRGKDLVFLIDRLSDVGPQSVDELAFWLMGQNLAEEVWDARLHVCTTGLHCLWQIGKLWREDIGWHAGAGCRNYRWGIRGVHPQRNNQILPPEGSGAMPG